MKTSELRYGNYVNNRGLIKQISGFRTYSTDNTLVRFEKTGGEYMIENLEPIQLTEELLLNFGFKNNNDQEYFYLEVGSENFIISINPYFSGISFFNSFDIQTNRFFIELKYVHQLQNLYFALTGEELILNY